MSRAKNPAKPKTTLVSVRYPPELLRQVDEFAAAKSREVGSRVSRSRSIVHLLREGLRALS